MTTMGFLGPQGTHSEAAVLYLNGLLPEPAELVPYSEIYAVMQAVENGTLDSCLVPVENSLEGSVNITLDVLAHSDTLIVTYELIWPVHNQLMVKYPQANIRRIFSHIQPLSQCRAYIQQHYPRAELIPVASTAKAARMVADSAQDAGVAAICTRRAGELYGLQTIAAEIQDNMANCTRFLQVRHRSSQGISVREMDKSLVICQIDGSHAGSLCAVLQEFASRGVNMTRIESRPARTKLGEYIFFFELETGKNRQNLKASIEAVRQRSIWLRHLGEFPVVRGTDRPES